MIEIRNRSWVAPIALFLAIMISVSGCTLNKPGPGEEMGPGQSATGEPLPKWMTTRDALGVNKPTPENGAAVEPFSKEPVQLARQLEARCRPSQQVYGKVDLPTLISALDKDGVATEVATEALIKANCGSMPEIVQEMVAEGGEPVVAAVVSRALLLAKPGTKWTIEAAAADGLERSVAGASHAATKTTGTGGEKGQDQAQAQSETPPPPGWITTPDSLGSNEPIELTNQLAIRCRKSRQVYGTIELTNLIDEIYRDGIEPTVATQALIKAGCGSAAEVVEGMVAKGGEPVVAAVVNQALTLAKPGTKWTIETAATTGLERNTAGVGGAVTKNAGSNGDKSPSHGKSNAPASHGSMTTSDTPGGTKPNPVDEPSVEGFSKKPARLRRQLAARCRQSQKVDGKVVDLGTLINSLYEDGIEPGIATEALIEADCGSVPEVVQGMVAEGGEPVRAGVVKQALPLAKPGTKWLVESAAATGLAGDTPSVNRSGKDGEHNVLDYVMGFFGSGATETDDDFVVPYGSGIPGYGIYTFILLGGGSVQSGEQDWGRYRELLRVVQGYVLAAETETPSAGRQRHVFVVPVRPDLRGASLEEQAVHALSARMRTALALYFDHAGRGDLSDVLRHRSGPLLVSSLEPTLIPKGPGSARMVTDLSDIGPEYLYAVVDAYDRPIPDEMVGLAKSFDPIHLRLSEVFTIVDASGTGRQQRGQPWIQIFGTKTQDRGSSIKSGRGQSGL